MRRRIKMKITKVRQQLVQIPVVAIRGRCPVCAREVETLATAHAAEVLEIDAERFNQLVAAGQVHVIETVSGIFRVCQDSLFVK